MANSGKTTDDVAFEIIFCAFIFLLVLEWICELFFPTLIL